MKNINNYITESKYTKANNDTSIKKWYMENFPTDDMGEELNDITFKEMFVELKAGEEYDDIIGVADSIIRERLFMEMSNIAKVNYDVIYKMWLDGADMRR